MSSSFFASCLTLLAGNLSKSILFSFLVLDTNSSSFKKNQIISLCKILAVSGAYLARDTCACTSLYHSSTKRLPCLKFVSRSNLALSSFTCGLQKSSYLDHIVSEQRSSMGKHQEIYWSIPKSPLQAMTFLHFFDSGNIASSQSRILSHFSFHFKNLWYKLSFTIQSILGPSI